MGKWWNILLALAVIALIFLVVPIDIRGDRSEKLRFKFDDYVQKFNKSYRNDTSEYDKRFNHFQESIQEIETLNIGSRGPDDHRARYGLTMFSDMSKEEFSEIHLSDEKFVKPPKSYGKSWRNHENRRDIEDDLNDSKEVYHRRRKRAASGPLPTSVDWRTKGVIGPIRSQGLCGACWAFSTIGTIESMAAIKTGKFQQLSVQEAIDCAKLGNSGCLGGDICLLLDWLMSTKSVLEVESAYPLNLINGVCKLKKNATGVAVKTFTCDDFVGDEGELLTSLATHGPVAVAVNALNWQNYLGGVIQYNCGGSAAELNHAVQLVGYDLTGEVPYYIARNSWGSAFGDSGYIKLAVGSNICGLANEVASVDVV